MGQEIFRFMTIRPPQAADSKTVSSNTINLNSPASEFIKSLLKAKQANSNSSIEKVVKDFVKSGNSGFIDSPGKVDSRFLLFYDSLTELADKEFYEKAGDAFTGIFKVKPKDFLEEDEFKRYFKQVADSISAAAIDPNISPKVRNLLVSLAKTLGFIQKLADSPESRSYSKNDFRSQVIVLPENIFPLPFTPTDSVQTQGSKREKLDKINKNRAAALKLAKDLASNQNAVKELLTVFEKSPTESGDPSSELKQSRTAENRAQAIRGFSISDTNSKLLSNETKDILKSLGLESSSIDVTLATSLIERQSAEISSKLYAEQSPMKYVVKIGNNLIPSDTLINETVGVFEDLGSILVMPGMCPAAPLINESGDSVTVPLNGTYGKARVLGIADLMLVEQDLLRYELGEISHVENVLESEIRERKFRTADTTEQSTLTETEVTDEKTKDLTSTERFELQSEAEKTINENSGVETGVTITASYGPSVESTANFNYTNSTSKQESTRASSNFARETTSRATSKIQKRTLERRFVKTVNEIEEINKHNFDNSKEGAVNITGIYRFIDKIYKAQIINYGKRLMLEFVVPEPAAFLRYAMTKQPTEGLTQIKPDPPGYCVNKNFIALQPKDITRDNYLYWASKYLAEDIATPPGNTQIISGGVINEAPGKKSEVSNDFYDAAELKDLKIPEGYKPLKGIITVEGWSIAKDTEYPATLAVQVQNQVFYVPNSGILSFNLENNITEAIPISVVTKNYEKYSLVANIFCVLTIEKFQEWQIKTYNSIMNSYNDLKSKYDTVIEAARIRAGYTQIAGTNPASNRETEQIELKKGCISLLTAQRFESFDSVKRNAAPHGYPEIAFADAQAEGTYIQFFENVFEWRNMLYVFYPYFWGKKDDWVTISQISDNDPLYTRFLQAGAGRVQVPVRPGFEITLLHYLNTGILWFGEGILVNSEDGASDSLHLSVLDELKDQLGNQNIEGSGRLTVQQNSLFVTGIDTRFTEDDENKRITIKGKTYLIKVVVSPAEIRLSENFTGLGESDVRYSIGGKLIGEPWEVKLPTDLVMIDEEFKQKIVDSIS